MRRFFDSSVLVAVFYAGHPEHEVSTRAFLSTNRLEGFCALRTSGEVYAVLTGLPLRPRISPREGVDIINQIYDRLTVVSLTESEYIAAIQVASISVMTGGAVYDALIAAGAAKCGAEVILTWNARDFSRFRGCIGEVKTPHEVS